MENEYDIAKAFEEIENELIDSMMRNFSRHRAEETEKGYNWAQWQSEQLKSLEKYRKENYPKFKKQFTELNGKVAKMLERARKDGNAKQEAEILQAIKNGFEKADKIPKTSAAEFFKLNDRKLDALIKATTDDLEKAETAILRRKDDVQRKAIFNAQVYANTGAGTYEKAVDMACKSLLDAGLDCVEYKNGARHTLGDYSKMAIRTANKRAYLYGEGEKRQEWGISTVVVNSRQGGCPKCSPYIGKVFTDDVYSGGSSESKEYPLLSKAIENGLFHPNCKDSTSTYYEGITTVKPVTQKEIAQMENREVQQQKKNYADRQIKRFERREKYSLDEGNKRFAGARKQEWKDKAEVLENIDGKSIKSVEKSTESGIIKNIELPADTDKIRSMSSETKDEISKAINKICDDYEVKIDEIVVKSLREEEKNVPFQFQADRNEYGDLIKRIVINSNYDFMGSQKEFQKRIMRNYDRQILSSNNVEGLIAHEMAHVMTFQDVSTYAGFLLKNKEVTEKIVYGISKYADASLDGAECIAEAFAKARCGGKLDKDAQVLIDEFIERWKK